MDRQSFFQSAAGRLFAATAALALVAAGIMALTGASAHGVTLPLIVLACVVSSILTVGLSVERFPGVALIFVLALPPVGGLYFAGLTVIGQMGTALAVLLLAFGAVAAWLVVRGAGKPQRHAAPLRSTPRAHAH